MPEVEDTRVRLLDAAGQLFSQRGFDGTNVRDITQAAASNLAAVNYHFGSKEALYAEAVRHAACCCDASTPMPNWPPGTPAESRLRDFIRAFLLRMLREDRPDWHRLLIFREIAEPRPGACEAFVRDFVRPTFEVLCSVLRDLVPADIPAEDLQLLCFSVVGQCLHFHHARHVLSLLVGAKVTAVDVERLTAHIYRFSLAAIQGIYPSKAKGARR